MAMISDPAGRPRRKTLRSRGRSAAARMAAAFAAFAATVAAVGLARADGPPEVAAGRFPTVPAEHRHARALLENSMRYLAPANKMIDPASGYPFEGWNHDPAQGLFLRSFTQLTAIGKHMELLADIVAGRADSPEMTREQALEGLTRLVTTLRQRPEGPEPRRQGAARQLPGPLHRQEARPADRRRREAHDPGGVRRRAGRGDLEGHAGQRVDRPAQQ